MKCESHYKIKEETRRGEREWRGREGGGRREDSGGDEERRRR